MLLSVRSVLPGRRLLWLVTAVALVATAMVWALADRASGVEQKCRAYTAAHDLRLTQDAGSGRRVAVIGDSYSVGLGLHDPRTSWPSRLTGRVHVDGFSGSGFAESSSPCGRVSFADRAAAVARTDPRLVVVEGGLNDVDRSAAEIDDGFARLLSTLAGRRLVVVGPARAPSRAAWVGAVDTRLAALSADAGVPYLRMLDLDLPYLDDGLHLTPEGHQQFGDAVADGLRDLRSR